MCTILYVRLPYIVLYTYYATRLDPCKISYISSIIFTPLASALSIVRAVRSSMLVVNSSVIVSFSSVTIRTANLSVSTLRT